MERNTYSVICILHGNVEQIECGDESAARAHAESMVWVGARCVEIYDTNDNLVWGSES